MSPDHYKRQGYSFVLFHSFDTIFLRQKNKMATVCIIDHVTDRVFLSVHGIQSNVEGDKILRTKRPKVKTHLVLAT